jgi:Transposase DDE domain
MFYNFWLPWRPSLHDFQLSECLYFAGKSPFARLTPGNVADPKAVLSLTQTLVGKLFGDKGYIGKKLAQQLLWRGLALLTRVRKNMKSLPLSMTDKMLLNARNMAETIIGHIKAFSSLNLPKHRSPVNAFLPQPLPSAGQISR